jgi:hypothetical protein
VSGPLGPYAEGFRLELAAKTCHPQVIGRHVGLMAELSVWLEDQDLSADALVAEVVQEFVRARRAAGCRDLVSVVAVAPLLGSLRGLGAAPVAGARVAVSARGGQRDEALVPVAADVRLLDADDVCRLWKVRKSWLMTLWRAGCAVPAAGQAAAVPPC